LVVKNDDGSVCGVFHDDVETTVRIQTVSTRETTDKWPRIGATAWSETNKPDSI
jgi:hypothetical protein